MNVINQHNKSQPLFLYLAHLAVHSANPYAPLQAPADIVAKFAYIKDESRRKFAGKNYILRFSSLTGKICNDVQYEPYEVNV